MDPKKKIITILIGLAISVLILSVFVVFPIFSSIKKDSEKLSLTKKDLILFKDKASSLEEIKKIYESWGMDFEKIEGLFVDPEMPVGLIEFWESSAINSGASISISPVSLKDNKEDFWESMAFQLSITGSFPDFLRFLQKAESGPYLTEIQDMNIKKLTEEELRLERYNKYSLGDINANLVIKVFIK